MFIRVKTSNNNKTTFVQIVQSVRSADRVTQRIIRHVGVARNADELESLKLLAESLKIKLEANGQEFLFKPEEVTSLKESKKHYDDSDYIVNVADLIEEQRLTSGIHEAYGKLFDDLGYAKVTNRPSRNKMIAEVFRKLFIRVFLDCNFFVKWN